MDFEVYPNRIIKGLGYVFYLKFLKSCCAACHALDFLSRLRVNWCWLKLISCACLWSRLYELQESFEKRFNFAFCFNHIVR